MVSLWPWKGNDSSPAAFEKTLSTLSTRIGKASSTLETTRQRSRRWRVLWTLYSSFVYLLYLMIAGLVIGWHNWGPVEYTAVSSAPVGIYTVRFVLSSFYDYQISKQQAYLQGLQKQRDDTINKLKEATKYNTTQQLLDKYGGTPQKQTGKPTNDKVRKAQDTKQAQKRRETTGFAPPPTANIPDRRVVSDSNHALLASGQQSSLQATRPLHHQGDNPEQSLVTPGADFAPNAFSEPRVYASAGEGAKWYDRLMDVILGEDEASPKNRIVLICQECRLVNGQAPPGVKTLEEIGKWRCSACGTMNGENTEAKKMIQELTNYDESSPSSPARPEEISKQHDAELDADSSDHTVYSDDEAESPRTSKAGTVRRRSKATRQERVEE